MLRKERFKLQTYSRAFFTLFQIYSLEWLCFMEIKILLFDGRI